MIGDGYTSVIRCEYADENDYQYHEPDAGPIYCGFPYEPYIPIEKENDSSCSKCGHKYKALRIGKDYCCKESK